MSDADVLGTLAEAFGRMSAGASPTGNYFFQVNAADAAASLTRAVDRADGWISVEERLPDHHGSVVCRTQERELQFGRVMTRTEYIGEAITVTKHWRGYPDRHLNVTHWFPLPEPPETK